MVTAGWRELGCGLQSRLGYLQQKIKLNTFVSTGFLGPGLFSTEVTKATGSSEARSPRLALYAAC
jgi:hypothetical protein